jgi:hypothetical protein
LGLFATAAKSLQLKVAPIPNIMSCIKGLIKPVKVNPATSWNGFGKNIAKVTTPRMAIGKL